MRLTEKQAWSLNCWQKNARYAEFSELVGLTISSFDVFGNLVVLYSECGRVFIMRHDQECCESVALEFGGDSLSEIVGSPVLLANEVSADNDTEYSDYIEWTFYNIATVNGCCSLVWKGESSPYYSTDVSFYEVSREFLAEAEKSK